VRFAGCGIVVMLPAASYAGVAQVEPTEAEMAVISFAQGFQGGHP
jgi:hypothetical protein